MPEPKKAKNKIVYGGEVLIDLTGDTATPEKVLKGATFHDKSGAAATGSCTFDSDTQDATAAEAELLKGQTAYVRGVKITGSMPNNGAVSGTVPGRDTDYTVPIGFHDGSGRVGLSAEDKAKLIPENIREGVSVLGVEGKMTGSEAVKAEAKEATPSTQQQTILPSSGYTHLSQVIVKPIPYVESVNAAGGTTVTIG